MEGFTVMWSLSTWLKTKQTIHAYYCWKKKWLWLWIFYVLKACNSLHGPKYTLQTNWTSKLEGLDAPHQISWGVKLIDNGGQQTNENIIRIQYNRLQFFLMLTEVLFLYFQNESVRKWKMEKPWQGTAVLANNSPLMCHEKLGSTTHLLIMPLCSSYSLL